MNLPPNLCYTIALDAPGQDVHRRMARLLVTSLLHTGWTGRIVVFRNRGGLEVLPEGHVQVEERFVAVTPGEAWGETMAWKYRLRDELDLSGIEKVLFLDCDCLALRNINHLMMGAWDIYTAPEPGRIAEFPFNGYLTDAEMLALKDAPGWNAGVIGIRATRFIEVMTEWERINARTQLRPWHGRDQHAWNRLLLDTPLRKRALAPGEVQFPFLHRAVYSDYRQAGLVHAAGRSPEEKLSLLFGLWMETFGLGRLEELALAPHEGRSRDSQARAHIVSYGQGAP